MKQYNLKLTSDKAKIYLKHTPAIDFVLLKVRYPIMKSGFLVKFFYDILNSEVIGYSYNYDRDINISEKRVIEVVITFKILLFKLQQIRNRFIYNILYANYKEAVKNNDF